MMTESFLGSGAIRRSLLTILIAGVVVALVRHRGEAAEAATPLNDREQVAQRLAKEGYALIGEPRRKGQFVVAVAVRGGASWRLVIDKASAEIVGRKVVVELIGAHADR
jgi:hypothetical protein